MDKKFREETTQCSHRRATQLATGEERNKKVDEETTQCNQEGSTHLSTGKTGSISIDGPADWLQAEFRACISAKLVSGCVDEQRDPTTRQKDASLHISLPQSGLRIYITCSFLKIHSALSPTLRILSKTHSYPKQLTDVIIGALSLSTLIHAKINLASAAPFGIVASSAINSTGPTIITGELGIFPNGLTSITGFGPGRSGTKHGADSVANKAHQDATTAYNAAKALTPSTDLTGKDLGGKVLSPGTYSFSSSVGLTGRLVLDGKNRPNSQFIFKIGSTLTTASAFSVTLINGAKACNVFWQVGSSATLGTTTKFAGNIMALASVTVNDGCTIQGGLYALTVAVTLIDDKITAQNTCTSTKRSSIRSEMV
ncbi:hypothetical protein MMC21_006650 [Puttea exsequens]|nr:hypothetical protein [Puttea exsequens]